MPEVLSVHVIPETHNTGPVGFEHPETQFAQLMKEYDALKCYSRLSTFIVGGMQVARTPMEKATLRTGGWKVDLAV